jgi:hypothetical protein
MSTLMVVGIPTWCEAGTIREHAEAIDRALLRGCPTDRAVIVNLDNRSPDGTRERFLEASTEHHKEVLHTAPGVRGKGHNWQVLFDYALEKDAAVAVTLDADLEVVGDDWFSAFGEPVLRGDVDVAAPLYSRFWYDANQSNQIVAPLVVGVTNRPIRQPIGGEYAFSPEAMRRFARLAWPRPALGWGCDCYVVLEGMRIGLEVDQVPLSQGKIHSWRSDTAEEVEQEMPAKFGDGNGLLLELLARWDWSAEPEVARFPASPLMGRPPKPYDPAHVYQTAERGYAAHGASPAFRWLLGGHAGPGPPRIDDDRWSAVLFRCLAAARGAPLPEELFPPFQALLFLRVATVLPQLPTMSGADVDELVLRVARGVRNRIRAA